ncbi:hypothetical protein HY641_02975 [Candidatus Woesearchaeota archaeon]|nr:hypothetical protein [Candidatus Woesearchaeota archaeon]
MRFSSLAQYSRFIAASTIVFMAELALTITLTEVFEWYFLKSYFFSLVIGSIALTTYNGSVTFKRVTSCAIGHRILCTIVILLMYVADVLSLYVLESVFGIHYILGIIIITPPFSLLNFVVNKQFLQHKDQPKAQRISGWRAWYKKRKK